MTLGCFPWCAFMLFPEHLPTLLGFIFGLCLPGCLLSVRQGYLGKLCWPFFHEEGFCLDLLCTQSPSLLVRLASLQPWEAGKFINFQYWHKLLKNLLWFSGLYTFCHTSFLYRIAVVRTKKLWDPQGATCSSKEVLLLWEVPLSRYVPFFPLWFPVGGFVTADSLSGLNFDVVPILGSVYAM